MSKRICPKCGNQIGDNVKFCASCGHNVNYDINGIEIKNSVETNNQKPNSKSADIALVFIIVFVVLTLSIAIFYSVFTKSENNNDNGNNNNQNHQNNQNYNQSQNQDNLSFNEQILYNGNDVIIKLTGYEKAYNGINLKIYIENNSNLNLGFNAHSYAVNGIMTGNNIYDMDTDVAAGKKANAKLLIDEYFLEEHNINNINYIDVNFWAYNHDLHFKSFETGAVRINNDNGQPQNNWMSGENLYEKNGIKIDYLEHDGNKIKYAITNTTGSIIDFDIEGITFNDYTSSDWYLDLMNEQILNNCQFIFELEPENEFMKLNNISKVESVNFYVEYRINGSYFNENKTDMIHNIIK